MAEKTHFIRGLFFFFFLAPICLLAGISGVLSILNMVVASWLPQNWFSENAADWIWGTGSVGDAANYFRIMICGVIAYSTASVIKWAFTGEGLDIDDWF